MKLGDYMQAEKIPDARAASELGCTVECIRLWRRGARTPRRGAMAAIERWSAGVVTAADFYAAGAAAGANAAPAAEPVSA